MAVLVVADNDNAHLRDTTHKTVTAALAISGDVDVLVMGEGASGVAAAAGKIEGVRKVLLADSADLGHRLVGARVADLECVAGRARRVARRGAAVGHVAGLLATPVRDVELHAHGRALIAHAQHQLLGRDGVQRLVGLRVLAVGIAIGQARLPVAAGPAAPTRLWLRGLA